MATLGNTPPPPCPGGCGRQLSNHLSVFCDECWRLADRAEAEAKAKGVEDLSFERLVGFLRFMRGQSELAK